MSYESSLALALISFVAMVTPGPGVMALIGHALSKGLRHSAAMISGMVMGDLTFLIMVIGGLSVIARSFETAFLVIRILAAAYLVYLGVKAWRAGPLDFDTVGTTEPGHVRGFFSGLLLTDTVEKLVHSPNFPAGDF